MPLQHDVDADEAAQRAGERRDDQAVAEELELERAQQLVDHAPAARRDAATCARRGSASTTTGMPACSSTSIGAP